MEKIMPNLTKLEIVVFVLGVICTILGFIGCSYHQGYKDGKKEVRKFAYDHGLGRYEFDGEGDKKFVWKRK